MLLSLLALLSLPVLLSFLALFAFLCDGGPAAHTHNAHHAPRTPASGVLNGQLHFSTPVVLDSKCARGCEAGWHKHTADDWQQMIAVASPHHLGEEEQI